jgi:hypothetical protein
MTPFQLRRMKKNLDTLTREKKEKEIAELKHQKAMSERICQEKQKFKIMIFKLIFATIDLICKFTKKIVKI